MRATPCRAQRGRRRREQRCTARPSASSYIVKLTLGGRPSDHWWLGLSPATKPDIRDHMSSARLICRVADENQLDKEK
jgi:hypothetical protein